MVGINNWGHCHFASGDYKVSISIGANYAQESEPQVVYFINKYQKDELIHQISVETIEEAVNFINSHYSEWEFIDLEKKLHDSGCSTCRAH